jgi:hypothetical protein
MQFVDTVSKKAPYLLPEEKKEEVVGWFSDLIDKNARPLSGLKRREVVLFPPGKCVHFYRDGVGISAVSHRPRVFRGPIHFGQHIADIVSFFCLSG